MWLIFLAGLFAVGLDFDRPFLGGEVVNASVGSSPARDDVVGRVCVTEFLDNFHLGYEATLCRDAEGFLVEGPKVPDVRRRFV